MLPKTCWRILLCNFTMRCTLPEYVSMKNGLKGTYMCKLQTCVNTVAVEDIPKYFDAEELDGKMSGGDEEERE